MCPICHDFTGALQRSVGTPQNGDRMVHRTCLGPWSGTCIGAIRLPRTIRHFGCLYKTGIQCSILSRSIPEPCSIRSLCVSCLFAAPTLVHRQTRYHGVSEAPHRCGVERSPSLFSRPREEPVHGHCSCNTGIQLHLLDSRHHEYLG